MRRGPRRWWTNWRYTTGVLALLLLVCGPLLASVIVGSKQCHEDHGQYVRGLYWFTCVK